MLPGYQQRLLVIIQKHSDTGINVPELFKQAQFFSFLPLFKASELLPGQFVDDLEQLIASNKIEISVSQAIDDLKKIAAALCSDVRKTSEPGDEQDFFGCMSKSHSHTRLKVTELGRNIL